MSSSEYVVALTEADRDYLVRLVKRQAYSGHCGEENAEIRARHDNDDRIERITTALAAASPSSPREREEPLLDNPSVARIHELIEEGDGFWRPCTGCHETEDGYDVGNYPTSRALKSKLGSGCRECGGLGAIWDNTDYADMARFMLAEDKNPTSYELPSGWSVQGDAEAIKELTSLLAPTGEGEAEPVAWRWRQLHHEIDGPITDWTYGPTAPDFSERHRWEVQPLYASPTSGENGKSSSRDHAHSTTDGQGNPTLATSDAPPRSAAEIELLDALWAYRNAKPQCDCGEHSGCGLAAARANADRIIEKFKKEIGLG